MDVFSSPSAAGQYVPNGGLVGGGRMQAPLPGRATGPMGPVPTLNDVALRMGGLLGETQQAADRATRIANSLAGVEPQSEYPCPCPVTDGSLANLDAVAGGTNAALGELHRQLSRIETALGF